MNHGSGHTRQRHDGGAQSVAWADARRATVHCLTGCAIGEVLGMVIGTTAGLSNGATVALSIALAFFFGYALTVRGVLRIGLSLRLAVRVALAADTGSILVMELVDNTVVPAVPGAMDAGGRQSPVLGGGGHLSGGRVRRDAAGQPRPDGTRQGPRRGACAALTGPGMQTTPASGRRSGSWRRPRRSRRRRLSGRRWCCSPS